MCGSPIYASPEIIKNEYYGTKTDMWSLGVIVFILLGGCKYLEVFERSLELLSLITVIVSKCKTHHLLMYLEKFKTIISYAANTVSTRSTGIVYLAMLKI